jgi:hypothetical protein
LRFSARGAPDRLRSPLLERLLARADEATAVTDWRADAFRIIAPDAHSVPSVAAAALFTTSGAVMGESVFLATPVHYLAEMTNVRLAADGIVALRATEAENLADDFNRVWHDAGVRFVVGKSAELFCVFDRPLSATTHDPEEMLDRHIDSYLPEGEDAPRLRHLMSEIEMWLFDHAVNRSRSAEALVPVNGLWLWGGGAVLESMPPMQGWAAGGADPLFKLFGAADRGVTPAVAGTGTGIGIGTGTGTGIGIGIGTGTSNSSGGGTGAGQGERGAANSAVIVVAESPGTEAWRDVETRWLEPALEQLRSRRLARLDLSAGARCYRISVRWSRRFWRRPRPWWESFE